MKIKEQDFEQFIDNWNFPESIKALKKFMRLLQFFFPFNFSWTKWMWYINILLTF